NALISITVAALILCLGGCLPKAEAEPSPLPSEEMTKPPADEWTPPPLTPTPAPRTAEEVLPPIEKDIFAGRDDFVYAQSFSAGPYSITVILDDGSVLKRGDYMPSDPDITGFGKETSFADNYVYLNCEQFDTFAIDKNDVLWGWGAVSSWGNITGIKPADPSPYRLLTDVQMASTSAGTYLALRKDGSVWMWGGGAYGQLGMGPDYKKYTQGYSVTQPVKVLENCVFADIGSAIKTDGSLWVWGFRGFNSETGEKVCYYRPVHVMDDVKYANGCFAVKTDGTLWALNSHWNDRENSPWRNTYYPEKPVQIMEDVKYAQGGNRYMVIKNDGSLWVWGDNTNGVLGDGTEDYIAEPMKLMDKVVWVDTEMFGIYALKANGELWGAGCLRGEADPSADMENPPTQEEIRRRRLPHKILDGVLVGSRS
ncbi:MAG: hypothetical protein RR142_12095, partial [Clostridia bacterium]